MNNNIYKFKESLEVLNEKEKNDLMKCYDVIFSLLTDSQRERIIFNYNKYKKWIEEFKPTSQPIPLYLYTLRHIELSVLK